MAEGGEEWTTIDRKATKKKSKQEDEWQVQPGKKDRRKKDSVPNAAPSVQAVGRGGGRGRGDGGDRGRGRGWDTRGGRGGTLPRKDSRASKPPGGPSRGGTMPQGRGGHTPSPGPGGRPTTPLNAPTVRSTPPPVISQGPALQGAWASKATPSSLEATPPPSQDQSVPRKSSWANIAKDPAIAEPETNVPTEKEPRHDVIENHQVTEEPKLNETEATVKTVEAPKTDEESENNKVTEELTNYHTPVKDEVVKDLTEGDTSDSKEELLNKDKLVTDDQTDLTAETSIKDEEVIEVAKNEPTETIVIKEEEKQTVIGKDVVIADSNGNFPTDANENITVINKDVMEDEPVNEKSEINSNVVEVDISDKKPMTNGFVEDKESKDAGLPYTPNQWSPLNPEGKKQYERDFLLQLQKNPLSLQKPIAMPTNMEIILPEADILRHVASAPNLSDFTPQYVGGKNSSRGPGTPNRRGDSRQKSNSSAAARLGVKVISLPREEVKLNEAENAWKPTVKEKKPGENGETTENSEDDPVENLAKRVRSILNKLCPQKFDTLVQQFRDLPIDSKDKLAKCMELVFEKALDEPVFSVAYARMCHALSMKKVATEEGSEVNFRSLLITRCQTEFVRDYMEDLDRTEYVANLAKATTEEEKKKLSAVFAAQETKLRRRSLGNIRFIGELYRISMLNGRIMHECIQKLLRETDEESLECMCRLITTVGQQLDKETEKVLNSSKLAGYFSLDSYFQSIRKLIDAKVSTSRIRFLMQDVLDLRTANWVARREVTGPKTIEQIHEDAAREVLKKQLAAGEQGPPPGRRSEDRGDRRRSQVKPPPKEKQQVGQDGWSNVAERPARMSQGKIDTNRLRNISRVDVNSLSLGPPSGSRPGGFSSWGRGSAQGVQQKKTSVQVQPTNRFAMFNDDDDGSMVAPQPQYHGRASEPAIRTYTGRNSREGSHSRENSQGRDSREGSYTGRHSNREGGRNRNMAQTVVPEAEAISNLRGSKDTSMEALENKTKAILEEYFGLGDLSEAYQCLMELYHAVTIPVFMENMFNCVLEKSSKDRIAAGQLLSHLLKQDCLPQSIFAAGVLAMLEVAEDMAIDIPKFWLYLSEILAQPLLGSATKMSMVRDSCHSLPSHLVERFLANLLGVMLKADQDKTRDLWSKSGLKFGDLNLTNPDQFCKEHDLQILTAPVSNGLVDPTMYDLITMMVELAASKDPNPSLNGVFDYITENFKNNTTDKSFIRNLVSSVIQACLDGLDTAVGLDQEKLTKLQEKLTKLGGILKPYLDAQKDREVQALYSLQTLVHKLEHPNKLLHSIFDVLYEIEVISEDAFIEWEESTDAAEQEGKGVALKSCTQFFQWLKEAEAEDEPEEPQKAIFSIGDEATKSS